MLSPQKGTSSRAAAHPIRIHNRNPSLPQSPPSSFTLASPPRRVIRETKTTRVATSTPPPKKIGQTTTRSPYASPGSPIASAARPLSPITSASPRQKSTSVKAASARKLALHEETSNRPLKLVEPVYEPVGKEKKNETLFSPAYKIEPTDENHRSSSISHQPQSDQHQGTMSGVEPSETKINHINHGMNGHTHHHHTHLSGEEGDTQMEVTSETMENGTRLGVGTTTTTTTGRGGPGHGGTLGVRPQPQQIQQTTTQQGGGGSPEEFEDEFDPFLFIKNLPPLPPEVKARKAILPKRSRSTPPVCLALDLDETLVHCSIQPLEKAELTFGVTFNSQEYKVFVRMRPYLAKFLRQVSAWFEIVVFTASQKVYADKLLNILDPKRRYIKHRIFRDSCVCVDGNYLKDLTVLGRDLSKVAIVDNSVQAFGFQLNNGIPIESWFDDDDDQELLNLIPFLQKLKDSKDVRPLIKKTFRLEEFVNSL